MDHNRTRGGPISRAPWGTVMANENPLELLVRLRNHKKKELDALDRAIGALQQISDGSSVTSDNYVNMQKVNAVVKYLNKRGSPANLYSDVLPALRAGGCDLGRDPERHARNLKIAVRMNSKPGNKLAYDERTETVTVRLGAEKCRPLA